ERELQAVRDGEFETLAALDCERRRVLAELPVQPPVTARPALERARDAQAELIAALLAAREATGRELGRLRQGRGAVRAYGHVGAASMGAVASRTA
ncbi:MAG TPA: flagellar protein FliT, partial [Phenylobacterium sp.]